ncbi:ATP binding [Xanthoria calcicola]
MAMLASKTPYPSSMGMGSNQASSSNQYSNTLATHRTPVIGSSHNGPFASPTESEFSDGAYESPETAVRSWDERRVCEWLRSINCAQYEHLFKLNNVTGSNLIECDQLVLKEMGIKKIGDRVRIFVAIKQLRTKALGHTRKRMRDSIAALEANSRPGYTPSSAGSPRARERPHPTPPADKRYSRVLDPSALANFQADMANHRPSSPLAESARRYGNMSPTESIRNNQAQTPNYFSSQPPSAKHPPGRGPGTPGRQLPVMQDSTVGKLPMGPVIRVIYNGGQTKVLDIKNCRTAEEIMLNVLRKLNLPEKQTKNHCFYLLSGVEPSLAHCHRLTDDEVVRVCNDLYRSDRGRLILRKIHAGEPDDEELRKAASISTEENMDAQQSQAIATNLEQSKTKVQQLTGEDWDSHPPVSASYRSPRERGNSNAGQPWTPPERSDSHSRPKMKSFLGARPPSELISQELTTYFPHHQKETLERTVRMSMRRSARLSRAASRISVASNASFTSNLKDAPPLPNIADGWLTEGHTRGGPRPLSVSRFAVPQVAYRDSVASSSLQPLQEESPSEPNRKSYVSFESDSQTGLDESSATLQSYFDESGSSGPVTEAGGSLTDQLTHAIADDGEGPDEELDSFLKGDSWDNVKWMKGTLIGQGSFGSVYLALHSITGELMAVKQVEVPSNNVSTMDKKKESMINALKREIDLLRDLQHQNIVQYLGSNSDDEHFNIFLEYVPGGSVAGMLNSYGQLHEPLIRNFVRQILTGLSYLHGKDIIHRDIKGANVLVDGKGNIKISDFGISKRVEASALLAPSKNGGHLHRPSLQGSVFWMAPEVVKQTSYTRKADIWSLGCLIVEMFTGTHPFPNCSQLQAIFQIGGSSAKPTTPDNISEEGKAFLNKTFEIDHEKRPSADELLLHPFLKQIA